MNISTVNNSETAINANLFVGTVEKNLSLNLAVRILLALSVIALIVLFEKSSAEDLSRGVDVVDEAITPSDFGNYHALVVGINRYQLWENLKHAEKDADDIQDLLINTYTFPRQNVTVLKGSEATREGILKALRYKLVGLNEKDSLLVFYAGHGQLDTITERGYWIPHEGHTHQAHTWISFSTVQDLLLAPGVKAKSVIIVTDSCYAGSLQKRSGPTPGNLGPNDLGPERYQKRLIDLSEKRSRLVIASGGFETVPDKSQFAAELKKALKNNPYPYIDMELLFYTEIFPKLKFIGQQDPSFSRLITGPDHDGQFVLVKKTTSRAVAPIDDGPDFELEPVSNVIGEVLSPQKALLTVRSNLVGDTVFINDKKMGSTRLDVKLDPGKYDLRIVKQGYRSYQKTIELAVGDETIIRANMKLDQAPPPIIEFYEIKPASIDPGEGTTLTWRTRDATSVNISGLGNLALSGSMFISPTEKQTFKITARNNHGVSVVTKATVNVHSSAPPIIHDFSAVPTVLQKGRTSVLSWRTANADQVLINKEEVEHTSGLKRIKPNESIAYTLVVRNKQGRTTQRSIAIEVMSSQPEIEHFRAEQKSIIQGEPVVLHWKTLNADSVVIQPLEKLVGSSGSLSVNPLATTAFTLMAKNLAGQIENKTVTVKVNASNTVTTKNSLVLNPNLILQTDVAIPIPRLVNRSAKKSYMAGGKRWVRYPLGIKNWQAFPAELFRPAPDLPACGLNTKASRTWVDIYDAISKKPLYRYCAITSRKGLMKLSFALPRGTKPPSNVVVVLTDRKTGKKYSSNTVTPR